MITLHLKMAITITGDHVIDDADNLFTFVCRNQLSLT